MNTNGALGILDKKDYGDLSQLSPGMLVTYVRQLHDAIRAKKHTDLRLGTPETGLHSWAVPKHMPEPGQKHLAIHQPLHAHSYGSFEGEIPKGEYGAGNVKLDEKGEALITRRGPDNVHFTVSSKGVPERYSLIKTDMGKSDKNWLLVNTTPTKPTDREKRRYVSVPTEQAEKLMASLPKGYSVSAKIDGASTIQTLLKDKIEAVSFRTSKKTGYPIIHSERLGLYNNPYKQPLPKDLEGTTLRSEIYGTRNAKAIPPQELGGLLNSSISKSLRDQKEKNIQLKSMLFDVDQMGKQPVDPKLTYLQRHKLLESLKPYLHEDKMQIAPQETTSEGATNLWNQIKNKQHPLTNEGVIINRGSESPLKAKLQQNYDVLVHSMFPGKGRLADKGVGGFSYSLQPDQPAVGNVGSGLSDQLRSDMHTNPDAYIGRTAKITAQNQLPSGKFRTPVLHSFHEDPVKTAEVEYPIQELFQMRAADQAYRQTMGKPGFKVNATIDSNNTNRLKQLFAQHGWPKDQKAQEAAWLLTQHADHDRPFQQSTLDMMTKSKATPIHIAYLTDRLNVASNKPQMYGTQYLNGVRVPSDAEDQLEIRRKAMGFPMSLQEQDEGMKQTSDT